ncbi:hypothetical protein [Streptomyces sp. RTGN2]|uniref:hypothetical protein n=1 Tax=Streptomyces sp. RTGN2 TaxID=3016525 RepID=UPI0025578CD6|nr:hypothetical protein [Streptomyces sp. RTGN2]
MRSAPPWPHRPAPSSCSSPPPGSALAAEGQFRYTYMTSDGYEAVGFMNNPESGLCINIQGPGSEPGSAACAPKNRGHLGFTFRGWAEPTSGFIREVRRRMGNHRTVLLAGKP